MPGGSKLSPNVPGSNARIRLRGVLLGLKPSGIFTELFPHARAIFCLLQFRLWAAFSNQGNIGQEICRLSNPQHHWLTCRNVSVYPRADGILLSMSASFGLPLCRLALAPPSEVGKVLSGCSHPQPTPQLYWRGTEYLEVLAECSWQQRTDSIARLLVGLKPSGIFTELFPHARAIFCLLQFRLWAAISNQWADYLYL